VNGSAGGRGRGGGLVLLLIDVINPFDFDHAERLLRHALPAAKRIRALKRRCCAAGVPVIYANDNFGAWRSDFRQTVRRCQGPPENERGLIARMLEPTEADYFVLKPKHSAFYLTPLELLLRWLSARRLILTGFATDMCVLHTAADAHMREFGLIVPSDCVAAESAEINRFALLQMRRGLHAHVSTSSRLRLGRGRVATRAAL
jgi:nicotinamidase-related amidase